MNISRILYLKNFVEKYFSLLIDYMDKAQIHSKFDLVSVSENQWIFTESQRHSLIQF